MVLLQRGSLMCVDLAWMLNMQGTTRQGSVRFTLISHAISSQQVWGSQLLEEQELICKPDRSAHTVWVGETRWQDIRCPRVKKHMPSSRVTKMLHVHLILWIMSIDWVYWFVHTMSSWAKASRVSKLSRFYRRYCSY